MALTGIQTLAAHCRSRCTFATGLRRLHCLSGLTNGVADGSLDVVAALSSNRTATPDGRFHSAVLRHLALPTSQ